VTDDWAAAEYGGCGGTRSHRLRTNVKLNIAAHRSCIAHCSAATWRRCRVMGCICLDHQWL